MMKMCFVMRAELGQKEFHSSNKEMHKDSMGEFLRVDLLLGTWERKAVWSWNQIWKMIWNIRKKRRYDAVLLLSKES